MDENIDIENKVYKNYLSNRQRVLEYTNEDMNLKLEKDDQVYIAVFDMPLESGILGAQTMSLALVFGLNTHIYRGTGDVLTNFEKIPAVMTAMQSLLMSAGKLLPEMTLTDNLDFYNSDSIRVYFKTRKGIYFRELSKKDETDRIIQAMIQDVLSSLKKV